MRIKYVVGLMIIAGFIVFAGINLQKSFTPYVTIAEAKKAHGAVQVKGTRVVGSEAFDMQEKVFRFRLLDPTGEEIEVVYHGVKPANFEQAREVVAIGTYRNGRLEAEQLLIKCPSKYQAEGAKS
ncbi:MAG: cytochrome c maturation protein CcmE [Calditrichaeota bacterium]|nr:MAG: cytochrome c maturation protein CcmE [Calditrichota bacterium]